MLSFHITRPIHARNPHLKIFSETFWGYFQEKQKTMHKWLGNFGRDPVCGLRTKLLFGILSFQMTIDYKGGCWFEINLLHEF